MQNDFTGANSHRPQHKLNIKDTSEVVCEKCQHNVFQLGIFLRKVSPILTGTGKPSYLPIENVAFYCVKCGSVNSEFIPEELKANRLVV